MPYTLAILKGKTKPARATWFIWIVVTLMLLVSYYKVGGGYAIWVSVAYLVTTIITAILSIKYGLGGWTRLDKICIAGCAASLGLWFVSGSAEVALFATLAVDVAGAIPTIASARKNPEHENSSAWLIAVCANTFNLFAVPSWDLVHVAYPIYLFLMVSVIAYYSLRKNKAASQI